MGAFFSWPSLGRDMGSFEGTWQGDLKLVALGNLDKESEPYKLTKTRYEGSAFKIIIRGQRASVYFGETEVKPTLFQAQIYMTNAIVFASDAGEDRDGKWVETWNFTLTQKNSETLIACFSRVVNNLDVPEKKEMSKFFVVAVGELHRMPP
jgi:hypothetical protein